MRQTDARFAAIAGLDLGYRLLGEPRCCELARGLGPVRYTALARLPLGRSAITSTICSRARPVLVAKAGLPYPSQAQRRVLSRAD